MSLARAFTTRRAAKPQISAPMPERSGTVKHSFAPGTIRNKISGPVELLSTTNMLSYNAPDLYPSPVSSSSSSKSISDNESEALSVSTAPTSPDYSMSEEISPNHLSCYFGATSSARESTSSTEDAAPVIPSRSPSHTKKTHEIVHRKQSISRMSSRSKNSVTNFARDSLQMFAPTIEVAEPVSPFEKELSQVTEMVEELGANSLVVDQEELELRSQGFFKFGAADYMDEISGLYMNAFGDNSTIGSMWI